MDLICPIEPELLFNEDRTESSDGGIKGGGYF